MKNIIFTKHEFFIYVREIVTIKREIFMDNSIKSILGIFPQHYTLIKEEANSKIDGDFTQHLEDCGLISALFSISQTKEGAQAIEDSLVIVRDEEDNILEYNVTFKGTGETYTVTQDELKKAKKPDENGRVYSTGDDDVTVYEYAMEKCFKESDDETLKEILNNYPKGTNPDDVLNAVTPASVSYLLLGEPFDTIKTHKDFEEFKNGASYFIPDATYSIADFYGNEIEFKEGCLYTKTRNSTDGEYFYFKGNESEEEFIINAEDFYNNIFAPNEENAVEHARAMLDNFEQNPLSNSIVFGTTGECTVECTNGKPYNFDSAHAYSVIEVNGDNVIMANASTADNQKYIVDKNSLLNLESFWLFGSENQDSEELIIEDMLDKEAAVYYPNLLCFLKDKLFGKTY